MALKLRPMPQPHIAAVVPERLQAAQGWYEYWQDADRILRALAKFVNEDEPYVPEFATNADVYAAASGNKILTSEILASASESVEIEDGPSPEFDWAGGINRFWVAADDRTVPNPTNVQPGTWRTILLSGDDATDRTITFDTNYGGDIPDIVVNSTAMVLLSIFAVSSSHLLVSAMRANAP